MGGHADDERRCDELPARIQRALQVLFEASDYARLTTGDRWEYAVEIEHLRSLGLSSNDLRFLVRVELVEHASEVTLPGQDGRRFQPEGDLSFTERTCFALTPRGVATARQCFKARPEDGAPRPPAAPTPDEPEPDPEPRVPTWDPERRVLSFHGRIVKRFKWHAANQERLLAAFQEEGWPVRIDDPLPPQPEQDSKRRLSDTIKCLNRKQDHPLLHFRGDGTGEGVIWEPADPEATDGKPQ